MPRVAVASLMHESNSFNPALTTIDDFHIQNCDLQAWSAGNTEVAGFLAGAEREQVACVPVFWASATPSGPVAKSAYEQLADGLLEKLTSSGPYDGVYLAL